MYSFNFQDNLTRLTSNFMISIICIFLNGNDDYECAIMNSTETIICVIYLYVIIYGQILGNLGYYDLKYVLYDIKIAA